MSDTQGLAEHLARAEIRAARARAEAVEARAEAKLSAFRTISHEAQANQLEEKANKAAEQVRKVNAALEEDAQEVLKAMQPEPQTCFDAVQHNLQQHHMASDMLLNAAGAHEVAGEHVATEADHSGGPWLLITQIGQVWWDACIAADWAHVEAERRRAKNVIQDGQVVVIPLCWIGCVPDMLAVLSEVRTLLRNAAEDCNPALSNRLLSGANTITATIAKASPPKREGEKG